MRFRPRFLTALLLGTFAFLLACGPCPRPAALDDASGWDCFCRRQSSCGECAVNSGCAWCGDRCVALGVEPPDSHDALVSAGDAACEIAPGGTTHAAVSEDACEER